MITNRPSNFSSYGLQIVQKDGTFITINAGNNMTFQPQGNFWTFNAVLPPNLVYNTTTAYQPPPLKDADATSNSIYYSTDSNKLSYKDPSGVSHTLY